MLLPDKATYESSEKLGEASHKADMVHNQQGAVIFMM
jgi:hypothetical protein